MVKHSDLLAALYTISLPHICCPNWHGEMGKISTNQIATNQIAIIRIIMIRHKNANNHFHSSETKSTVRRTNLADQWGS